MVRQIVFFLDVRLYSNFYAFDMTFPFIPKVHSYLVTVTPGSWVCDPVPAFTWMMMSCSQQLAK